MHIVIWFNAMFMPVESKMLSNYLFRICPNTENVNKNVCHHVELLYFLC